MAQIKTFRDLRVWQSAHRLVLRVYKMTGEYPKNELYGIVSQMRRAAYSVPANIVEGFRRKDIRDSIRFYNVAEASLEELKYFMILSSDLSYIESQVYEEISADAQTVGKQLRAWVRSQTAYSA